MQKILTNIWKPLLFIIVCVLARILPHPANFTPIAAVALFGGTYLTKKQAFIVPMVAMVLSDLIIGFDSLPMRLAVYGSILIGVFLGFWIKKNEFSHDLTVRASSRFELRSFSNKNIGHIISASLLSSIIFFVITNFSVWAFGTMYSKSLVGLFSSYFYAIPFFRNTLVGDLFYSGIFFGGYEFIKNFRLKNKLIFNN